MCDELEITLVLESVKCAGVPNINGCVEANCLELGRNVDRGVAESRDITSRKHRDLEIFGNACRLKQLDSPLPIGSDVAAKPRQGVIACELFDLGVAEAVRTSRQH